MERQYYLDLADVGLTMPICVDLVLHEYANPEAILQNGTRLGHVIADAAYRFNTQLAIPHMDLELEKAMLLGWLGVQADEIAKYQLKSIPGQAAFDRLKEHRFDPFKSRMQAHIDSIHYIARNTSLLPIGMAIGPFSLMTKLVSDPITPIALAGQGLTAEDDSDIALVEQALELSIRTVLHSVAAQIKAGAKAIFIAEPAANRVYLSPKQIEAGADIFDRYVMCYNRQLKWFLDEQGVDLFFHCCGELTDMMVKQFCALDPAILSLGSSRVLWEDAAFVPKTTVLYGNLPSKQFYSDALITAAQVEKMGYELQENMRRVNHPFILGTECDVLCVSGCEWTLQKNVMAIKHCGHRHLVSEQVAV